MLPSYLFLMINVTKFITKNVQIHLNSLQHCNKTTFSAVNALLAYFLGKTRLRLSRKRIENHLHIYKFTTLYKFHWQNFRFPPLQTCSLTISRGVQARDRAEAAEVESILLLEVPQDKESSCNTLPGIFSLENILSGDQNTRLFC